MFGHPLGPGDADALLEGRLEPDDAPPGFQEVAAVVRSARSGPGAEDLIGEDAVVQVLVGAVEEHRGTHARGWRAPRRPSTLLKVASAASALALAAALVAAATGSLPQPVQAALSRDLSHIGVDVPDPGGPAGAPSGQNGGTATLSAQTLAQQCAEYLAASPTPAGSAAAPGLSSAEVARLSAAARDRGQTLAAFCSSVGAARSSTGDASENDTSDGGQGAPASTGTTDVPEPGSGDATPSSSESSGSSGSTSGGATEGGDTTSGQPSGSSEGDRTPSLSSAGSDGSSGSTSDTAAGGDQTPTTTSSSGDTRTSSTVERSQQSNLEVTSAPSAQVRTVSDTALPSAPVENP